MKITKLEALALAKALHSLGLSCQQSIVRTNDRMSTALFELSKRIDVFLLAGDQEKYQEGADCESLEGDENTSSSDREDGRDDEEPESFISGEELHDLKPLNVKSATLEFELRPAIGKSPASVDLIHDGMCVVKDVSDVRRSGKSLAVRSHVGDGEWSTFNVQKFTKDWTQALPFDVLVGVEA